VGREDRKAGITAMDAVWRDRFYARGSVRPLRDKFAPPSVKRSATYFLRTTPQFGDDTSPSPR
jgi:hypothetical protein